MRWLLVATLLGWAGASSAQLFGDSSNSLSVRTCTCRVFRSSSAAWNLPPLRMM